MTLFDNGKYRLCYYKNNLISSVYSYNTIVIDDSGCQRYYKTISDGADFLLDNDDDLTLEEALQLFKYKNDLYNSNPK